MGIDDLMSEQPPSERRPDPSKFGKLPPIFPNEKTLVQSIGETLEIWNDADGEQYERIVNLKNEN